MASSSSSSTSTSTTGKVKKYDVFFSFRGEDTRNNLTSVLHGSLQEKAVNVFIDNDLKRGEEISASLMEAIEESAISVIIFSEGYASSGWCLQELVKIMDCRKTHRQVVLPVFYHVDPSHVRNQTGAFGKALAELIESCKDKLETERWKSALREAANISGWSLYEVRSEYLLAQSIVKDILEILNYLSPSDKKGLVGVRTIIYHIIEGLQIRRWKIIRLVGIWGMGGIGKTTIAKAIFNKTKTRFEDSYFAQNVREESMRPDGLIPLRKELLCTILRDQNSDINSIFTKRRLSHKRVLIIFDDVTSLSQIEFLIGDLNCLGPGSRIIITTRNQQVLRNCGVNDNRIYKLVGLPHLEALQLFSWYAFQQNRPNIDYAELSNEVVEYAGGLPLALKVLGSFLLGKPKEVWESAISKLKVIPHEDIYEVLKISYDGLNDVEKNIFLDIACFLKWENRAFVVEFLNACGFYAENGISVLIDNCLITISIDNKVTMHDLLQEMGWEIVRQESTRDLGKRSRLWFHEDIFRVLEENMGTKAVEAICLDMSKAEEIKHLEPCALARMRELRFLKLHNSQYEVNNINKVYVSQGLNSVSTQLRYLCWHGYPLKSLQPNFYLKNLIALDMPHSNIEQLWTGVKLVKLKHIDLSYSKYLTKIEDLSLAPNLESLILEGCTSLHEISSSIQCLKKLVILDLRHCKSLCKLPSGICLESLNKLIVSYCSNFSMFPEISCNMEELYLEETAIEGLSPSIENLSKLVILNLKNCSMLKNLPHNICKLNSLEHLDLSKCSKLDGLPDNLGNLEALKVLKAERVAKSEVPSSIVYLRSLKELNLTDCCISMLPNSFGNLSSVESLHLGRNYFEHLPTSIMELSRLLYLDISYCERLQSLPELPCNLQAIDAYNCSSLKASSSLSIFFPNNNLRRTSVNFSNCFEFGQDALKENVEDALQKVLPTIKEFNPRLSASICFPGMEIPKWFTFQSMGSSVNLKSSLDMFPSLDIDELIFSFAISAVVEFRNYRNEGQGLVIGCDCMLGSFGENLLYHGTLKCWERGNGPEYVDSDHIFMGYNFLIKFPEPQTTMTDILLPFEPFLPDIYDLYNEMTIQFYVENLNAEPIACCNVKRCGVQPLDEWSRSVISKGEKEEA